MKEKVFVNVEMLKNKVSHYATIDGLTMTNLLTSIGVSHACFGNAKSNYIGFAIKQDLTKEELKMLNCHYGYMQAKHLDGIGIGLGISTREYLVSEADIMAEINAIKSKRAENTPVEEKPVNGADMADFKALLDKLDEVIVAINKLGNIEMQNMETLNAIRKNWE